MGSMPHDAPDVLSRVLYEPAVTLKVLSRLDAEDRLLNFMHQGWASLEPGVRLQGGWPLEAICEHLEAVNRGEIRRLLMNVPPGCTKSMSTNVFFPAWEWGPRAMPHLRYISAAHEKTLTIRDNVRCRDLMLSEWYQSQWSSRWSFKSDQNLKILYENDAAGWRMASSTGSGLTGHRGDRIILDDPHAVRDLESEVTREDALRWFSETLPTRLNDQAQSAIVVIMQRVHDRDVSGLILKEDLGYEHLCLPMEFEPKHRCFTSVPCHISKPQEVRRLRREGEPLPRWLTADELAEEEAERPIAPDDRLGPVRTMYCWDRRTEDGELLWPERFPRQAVEELKDTFRSWGGTYAEAGQLQQRPAPRGGGMFQRVDFQILEELPAQPLRWVRGWDLAGSKDNRAAWTAGAKLAIDGQRRVIIADVRRMRGKPGEVEAFIRAAAEQDGRRTVIDLPQDPGQAGLAQKRYLAGQLQEFEVHASPESGSKEERARPLAAQAEAGNVFLLRGSWNETFINEATLFPNGDYKDQIDAASRAHARAVMMSRSAGRAVGPRLVGA